MIKRLAALLAVLALVAAACGGTSESDDATTTTAASTDETTQTTAGGGGGLRVVGVNPPGLRVDELGERVHVGVFELDQRSVVEDRLWQGMLLGELGLRFLAEGVETDEQERFLLEAGCPCGQGFGLGVPLSAEDSASLFFAD